MRYGLMIPVLALVAAVCFGLGWSLKPGVRFSGFPEAGELQPVSKPCAKIGTPLRDLHVLSEEAIRYAPGDSAAAGAVSFRRKGASAEVLVVAAGEPDDEVEAEAQTYQLRWDPPSGWVVTDCQSAVRYAPGRP